MQIKSHSEVLGVRDSQMKHNHPITNVYIAALTGIVLLLNFPTFSCVLLSAESEAPATVSAPQKGQG